MVTAALPWAADAGAGPDFLQLLTVLGGLLLAIGGVGTFLAGRAASRRFVPDTYRDMAQTASSEREKALIEHDRAIARKNEEIAALVARLNAEEAETAAVEKERDAWRERYYATLRHPSSIDDTTGQKP